MARFRLSPERLQKRHRVLAELLQQVAAFLPFQWAFGFTIELLLGKLTPAQALYGLGAQVFWTLLGLFFVNLLWRAALRRFSAVGA